MKKDSKEQTATGLALRWYLRAIWREKKVSIPALLMPGIGSIFAVYGPPLIVATMLQTFNGTKPEIQDAAPFLLAFAGVWMAGEVIWRIAFLFLNRIDSRGMRFLYLSAMRELAQKDIGFFHDNFAGSLTKKALGFGRAFEGFMDTLSFNVFGNLIPLIFVSIFLWQFSPLIVLALLALLVIALSIIIPLTKIRKKLVNKREAASNAMAGYVADVIGNMDAVQSFAHTDYELREHAKYVHDYEKKALKSWDFHTINVDSVISPIYVLINVVGLALAIALSSDATGLTTIFVTFNYFAQVTRILWEFNRIYRNLENAITEAGQFTELLLEPSALVEVPNPIDLKIEKGEIEFKKVTFAYENTDDPLFSSLNLHIQPGEKIALVGHSGGGKTTVTKLLLRFVDINSGELLIDGQNIAEARLRDLRSRIAYVPQEPVMFHRSIMENIRYGRLDASDEEVYEAAKKAYASEFIDKLPHGYDTMVGERGVKLSGGQRQRIAIARAILKNAPILVLDEATSALDSESEKYIQAALWKLMQNRTAIVIAHRLSTIQKMDRIIVLEGGAITEQGSHDELLKQKGTYAQLWGHQSGGFIEE